jgi:protein-S-isoprenylcysteine O-methyltransferase Ste14
VNLYRWIIAGLWLLFIAYWAVAAVGAKRNAGKHRWGIQIALRIALVSLVFALLQSRSLRELLGEIQRRAGHSAVLGWSGVALCLLGFGLAMNARRHLGRNWGMPMSRKQDAQLVTSGPYAFIRHPIYTGLLLATLGSAMGISIFWAPVLIFVGAYFIYSARREEAVMLQLFPEQYAAYRARTGMLTPCPLRRGRAPTS